MIRNELVYSKGRGGVPVKKVRPTCSWSRRAKKAVTSSKEESKTHLDRITAGMWMGMIGKNLLASQFMVLLKGHGAVERSAWLAQLVEHQSALREVEGSSPRPDQHSGS